MNNPDLLQAFLSVQSGSEKETVGDLTSHQLRLWFLLVCHTVSVSLSRFVFYSMFPPSVVRGPDRVWSGLQSMPLPDLNQSMNGGGERLHQKKENRKALELTTSVTRYR